METNLYQAPNTPNDQITQALEILKRSSTAYRVDSIFYCEPGFESPNVCFKTGIVVPEHVEKTSPWDKYMLIQLYFNKLNFK